MVTVLLSILLFAGLFVVIFGAHRLATKSNHSYTTKIDGQDFHWNACGWPVDQDACSSNEEDDADRSEIKGDS